jgi:hypothetical protein
VNLLWSIAYLAAGGCIFVYLMNRYFIAMARGWGKNPTIALVSFATLLLPAAAGWLIDGPLRPAFPAIVFTAAIAGEVHRLAIRRRHRGVRPVASGNGRVDLLRPFTTTDLAVTHYAIVVPGWAGPRIRIAHVTDFHASPSLPSSFYRNALELAAQAKPDFLFVTGDFVSDERNLPILEEALPAAAGVARRIAVLGNHDYWADPEEVARVVRAAGFDLLSNDHRVFEFGAGRAVVCGCDDPWGPARWTKPPVSNGDLFLVLSHTPDNIYELNRAGAHAVFSGHLHAGQFRIPWLGAVAVPSLFGRRYDHGHFNVEGTHLFVSAGIGANFPPIRVYCPPDLFVVDVSGC